MFVLRTNNRRWWNFELSLSRRAVAGLEFGWKWLLRALAPTLGLILPSWIIASLLTLQLGSEPDLEGGYEGLDGLVGLVLGLPAGAIGAALGGSAFAAPWRRRFLLAVVLLEIALIALGSADLLGFEIVR